MQMGRMEKQDLKVCRVFLVRWGHQATRAFLESLVKRECQAHLVSQDLEEIQAKMAWMALRESKVHRALQETEDLLGHQVPEGSRECRGHLAKQDSQEKMEMLAFLDPLVCLATKESRAPEVFLERGVPLVLQVHQA